MRAADTAEGDQKPREHAPSEHAHLVGLPRPVSCLQRFVEPFRHEHQEARHPIQRVPSVDFRLCYDGL